MKMLSYLMLLLLPLFLSPTTCVRFEPEPESCEMTEEDRKFILHRHNEARASVDPPAADMFVMTWNQDLEDRARRIVSRCEFEHSPDEDRTPVNYYTKQPNQPGMGCGENLHRNYFGCRWPEAMHGWIDKQREAFVYGRGSVVRGRKVGHYTQVIWANSTEIGCAAVTCKGPPGTSNIFHLHACLYCPLGNSRGRDVSHPYAVDASRQWATRCHDDRRAEDYQCRLCKPHCYGRSLYDYWGEKICAKKCDTTGFARSYFALVCARSCGDCEMEYAGSGAMRKEKRIREEARANGCLTTCGNADHSCLEREKRDESGSGE